MASMAIHQAIHGYRDGHRLLSSSITLSGDSARTMLILSDMSGPVMHPGFDEYLTGYALPGSEFFVFAKTWYAPEMQRPGCVWTHSLLLSREQLTQVSVSGLVSRLRRPQQDGVESAATTAIELEEALGPGNVRGIVEQATSAALVGAVLGQSRPVIVSVESAIQLERAMLRLWELWPRFSFCTGALMPRSVAGALMDLQAVPRAVSTSQSRRGVGAALVLDLRNPAPLDAWVKVFLEATEQCGSTFRSWLDAVAGANAPRDVVPSLAPIFGEWHAPDSSARTALASVVNAKNLDVGVRSRLVAMVFERASSKAGVAARSELLQCIAKHRAGDLITIFSVLEEQTQQLFRDSRVEGVSLVLALLGCELTEVGERLLRTAVLLLAPADLELLGEAQSPYLPTIVGANPQLAASPLLWCRVGDKSGEVLSQLGGMNLSGDERAAIGDAIIASGHEVSVDALIRFDGTAAVFRVLSAIASGRLQLSWPWRSALVGQRDTVLEWLESRSAPSNADLELASRFVSPKRAQERLATVWKSGAVAARAFPSRVAVFGLALAFWEDNLASPLFASSFQPTYDAATSSRLEYDEWEWVREYAPASSYWRDWDKCERLANAMARLFEKQNASLSTIFAIVHSRSAIKKVVDALDDERDTRPYLKALRKAAESSSVGTHEQRQALLEGW